MATVRVLQPAPAANADNGEVDRLAGVPAVTVAQASVRYPEADENVHSFARKPDRDAFLRATGPQGGSAENLSRRSPEVCGLGDAGQREQERVDFVIRHARTNAHTHTHTHTHTCTHKQRQGKRTRHQYEPFNTKNVSGQRFNEPAQRPRYTGPNSTTKHTGPNSIAQHHVTVEIVDGEAANSGKDACVQEGANPSVPVSTRPLAQARLHARTHMCVC